MRRTTAPWLILLLLCGSAPLAAQDTGSVRIYRCVGSTGAVSLQDAPCRDGRQEVREMQRPRDPAPRVVRSDRDPATPAAAPAGREVRYVHVQPPQPIYECIRDDGSRYTSDTSEGNPRWVSVWTSAWLPGRGPGGGHGGGHPGPRPLPPIMPMGSGSGSVASSGGSLTVSGGGSRVGGSLTVGGGSSQWQSEGSAYPGTYQDVVIPAGNVLVRDQCHPLPANEVCSILRDRRWELGRRYNSALQGERDAINREQRGIDARLDRDCR